MLSDRNGRPKIEIVLDALRRRICLSPPGEELRLHENALAAEFEMSRTPIRQVLQRLAYERLVETRSGVGTIAPAMAREDRTRDLRTHQGLLRAILEHDLGALSLIERSAIAALGAMVAEAAPMTRETAFEIRSGLLAVLERPIPDPILGDAFKASHWRVIRWHMTDFAENAEAAADALEALVAGLVDTPTRDAAELFRRLLTLDLSA